MPKNPPTHLHKTAFAMAAIQQGSHFEFVKLYPQDPVLRRASKRSEPIPACHGFAEIVVCHLWTSDILINIHRFITVVFLEISWKLK
ncbi:hypothetical protein GWI33_020063 [Rhynchophorus ferrugineus]|uniref:Uncharacterized protein n=1 Tax=Rhynchophorus ferrugineus TaxID=354439 RepID=A0A834HQ24_RHYFE|nr:hypothetical protein GWI33_020063 [Rhynchophorus ferrugineus]